MKAGSASSGARLSSADYRGWGLVAAPVRLELLPGVHETIVRRYATFKFRTIILPGRRSHRLNELRTLAQTALRSKHSRLRYYVLVSEPIDNDFDHPWILVDNSPKAVTDGVIFNNLLILSEPEIFEALPPGP